MIYPISFQHKPNNIKQANSKEPSSCGSSEDYKDPLASQWLNYVLCSTELGALIHEIAPRAAQALWIPTIMYLGADIYDKYKNDKNIYSPSRKRGVEQAIYQGTAGFLLPALSIFIGQKLTSPIGRLVNKGISVNQKESVLNHIKNSLDQCVGNRFNNYDNFEKFVINSLENKIAACKNEKKSDTFFKKIIKYTQKKYTLASNDTEKLINYARQNTKELYEIKDSLAKKIKPQLISKRSFQNYLEKSSNLKATYGKDYANDALRYALKSYQNKLIMKNKLIKTFGGLIALAVTINPIYNYVQDTVIPKYIDPNLDKFNKAILDGSILKQHIKSTPHKN